MSKSLQRLHRFGSRGVRVLTLALAGVAVTALPAGAAATGHPLRWDSPHSIHAGVAGDFRSVDPCPATRPDGSAIVGTRMVQLSVVFPRGAGATANTFPVAADGSWAVQWDPGISPDVLPAGRSTVMAVCLEVTTTGLVLARYRAHTVRIA